MSKNWKVSYVSHFGNEVVSETQRGAERLALEYLENEYGYNLARVTDIEVEEVQ